MSRAFSQLDYGAQQPPPILVIGDTASARDKARVTAESAGFMVSRLLPLDEAVERLGEQAGLPPIWLELAEAPGLTGQRLLERLGRRNSARREALVVSTKLEHLDEVLLTFGGDFLELLVEASEEERIAALSFVVASLQVEGARDASTEANAARLRQLSDEVNRIAVALARLSTASNQPPLSPETMAPPRGDVPNVSPEGLRRIIKARRMRAEYLPADLFADPAWDMLLDLLQAEIIQSRVPVSSLCSAAAVPATTALRWIKTMTDRGLLLRRDDPHDGRRVFIEMAPATSAALRHYFHDVGMAGV